MITASLDYFKELTNDSIETSAQKTNTTEYLSKVLEVITEKITGALFLALSITVTDWIS